MMDEDEDEEETHDQTSESPRSTRSRKILKTKPLPNKKRRKMEIMTDGEEAATISEPSNTETGQEYAQHEPDTLEKAIGEMMDRDDQKTTKTQNQSQKKQTSQETTIAGTEKPEPRAKMMMTMTKMTRYEQKPEETGKIDTGAQET